MALVRFVPSFMQYFSCYHSSNSNVDIASPGTVLDTGAKIFGERLKLSQSVLWNLTKGRTQLQVNFASIPENL